MRRLALLLLLFVNCTSRALEPANDPNLAVVRLKSHGASGVVIHSTDGHSYILSVAHSKDRLVPREPMDRKERQAPEVSPARTENGDQPAPLDLQAKTPTPALLSPASNAWKTPSLASLARSVLESSPSANEANTPCPTLPPPHHHKEVPQWTPISPLSCSPSWPA